jgi:hypothetical protein
MKCRSSANTGYWRETLPTYTNEQVQTSLSSIWRETGRRSPPYDRTYHDWAYARAVVLREARKRGLDISVTGLGT